VIPSAVDATSGAGAVASAGDNIGTIAIVCI
jgi:hypothetical protein